MTQINCYFPQVLHKSRLQKHLVQAEITGFRSSVIPLNVTFFLFFLSFLPSFQLNDLTLCVTASACQVVGTSQHDLLLTETVKITQLRQMAAHVHIKDTRSGFPCFYFALPSLPAASSWLPFFLCHAHTHRHTHRTACLYSDMKDN